DPWRPTAQNAKWLYAYTGKAAGTGEAGEGSGGDHARDYYTALRRSYHDRNEPDATVDRRDAEAGGSADLRPDAAAAADAATDAAAASAATATGTRPSDWGFYDWVSSPRAGRSTEPAAAADQRADAAA